MLPERGLLGDELVLPEHSPVEKASDTLGKRWTKRLTSGLSISAARAGVDALIRFSDFLAMAGVQSLADIDRPLLERYLAHAMSRPGGNDVTRHRISALNVFFQADRQCGWNDSLPGKATFYAGDTPLSALRWTAGWRSSS